jgi:hypothetical protein
MWLALAAIVVASAIGLNVAALWLTGYIGREQPESRNMNVDAGRPTGALGSRGTAINVLLTCHGTSSTRPEQPVDGHNESLMEACWAASR